MLDPPTPLPCSTLPHYPHARPSHTVPLAVLLLIVDAGLLAGLTADASIFYRVDVVEVTPFGLVVESRGQCTASRRVWKWIAALLGLHGVLIMWGNVLTYRLRNVPSDYNEGKYVGFSIANCMQTLLLALLILFLISDNPCGAPQPSPSPHT